MLSEAIDRVVECIRVREERGLTEAIAFARQNGLKEYEAFYAKCLAREEKQALYPR